MSLIAMQGGLMASAAAPPPTGVQTTWSSSLKASDVILSNGDIDAESNSPTGGGIVLGIAGKTSGKFYVEFELVQRFATNDAFGCGFQRGTANLATFAGADSNKWALWDNDASITSMESASYFGGTRTSFQTSISGNPVGRRICMAIDVGAGRVWFADDFPTGSTRVWRRTSGSPDPATNTDPTYTFTVGSDTYYIAANPRRGNATDDANRNRIRLIDPADWRYAAPAGFGVWTA